MTAAPIVIRKSIFSTSFGSFGFGSVARRRLHVRPAELLLGVVAVVAITLAVILVPAALGKKAPTVPFSSSTSISRRGRKGPRVASR